MIRRLTLFWKIGIIILIMSSCHSKKTKKLSEEICSCMSDKASEFEQANDMAKVQIIDDCTKEKIEAEARVANEKHLENNENSKLLDYMFVISKNTFEHLRSNCDFFINNEKELTRLVQSQANEF